MARIVHFEIPADNPERAAGFYKKAFGWDIQKWGGPTEYWLASTGPASEPGINGGILKRPQAGAVTCNTLGVGSLDQSMKDVESAGGKIVVPKMAVPGIGWLAYGVDTEGNQFGMMQHDPSAK
jgi:predicted enzyme related to lactoylglutathione lyase